MTIVAANLFFLGTASWTGLNGRAKTDCFERELHKALEIAVDSATLGNVEKSLPWSGNLIAVPVRLGVAQH